MNEQTKTHWRKLVNKDGPHLTVWDIQGHSPLACTIERTGSEQVTSFVCEAGSSMLFLYLKGAKKALGMCATNCAILEMLHGPYPEDWVGKRIVLRAANCKGEDCIRLDVPTGKRVPKRYPRFTYTDQPKQTAPTPPAPLADEQETPKGDAV
jgi:hypothetical protein